MVQNQNAEKVAAIVESFANTARSPVMHSPEEAGLKFEDIFFRRETELFWRGGSFRVLDLND